MAHLENLHTFCLAEAWDGRVGKEMYEPKRLSK